MQSRGQFKSFLTTLSDSESWIIKSFFAEDKEYMPCGICQRVTVGLRSNIHCLLPCRCYSFTCPDLAQAILMLTHDGGMSHHVLA